MSSYPVLYLFSRNPVEIDWLDVLKVVSGINLMVTLLWFAGSAFVRDRVQSAFAVAVLTFAVLCYGAAYQVLSSVLVFQVAPFRHKVLLPTLAVFLALVLRPRWKLGHRLHASMNTIGLVLVLLVTGQTASRLWATHSVALPDPLPQEQWKGSRPSVVLVVLDEYARADILRSHFGFDNSPFVSALRERGFVVAGGSRANYPWTPPSLATLLNAQYLSSTQITGLATDSCIKLIQQNSVFEFFRRQGYAIAVSSFSSVTDHIPRVDRKIGAGLIGPQFAELLLQNSLPGALVSNTGAAYPEWVDTRSDAVLAGFRALRNLQVSEPTLTLVHILCPHRPLFFDERGQALRQSLPERDRLYKALYPAQLEYLNREVLAGIDHLLSLTPRPVIVLISDHGSQLHNLDGSSSFNEPNQALVEERMGNLCALYFPDKKLSQAEVDGLAVVNIFRTVLNHYFEAHLDLLPTHCYWMDGKSKEITGMTKGS